MDLVESVHDPQYEPSGGSSIIKIFILVSIFLYIKKQFYWNVFSYQDSTNILFEDYCMIL